MPATARSSPSIPILVYHQISEAPPRGAPFRGLYVAPSAFARQMAMLKLLGFDRVVLMTNNPDKIMALEDHGVKVIGHRRLMGRVNPHNEVYLTTKAHRAGHLLDTLGLQVAGK